MKKINFTFGILNVAVSSLQSLWLISYIQRLMGVEAFGYIAVITSIVSSANIVTFALTSFTARYITVELHQGKIHRAREYFNSSLFGLVMMGGGLILLLLLGCFSVEWWLRADAAYIGQLRVLLLLTGMTFLFTTVATPMKAGVYYANKIYIMYALQILTYLARIVFAVMLYSLFEPKLWYAYLGSFLSELAALVAYCILCRRLMPPIKTSFLYVRWTRLKEILSSGIWVSINKAGAVLLTSVNTYLISIIISAYMTGIYSTITQFVSLLGILTMSIVLCFVPEILKLYARNDRVGMERYLVQSTKFLSIVMGILAGGIAVYEKYFLNLFIGPEYLHYGILILLTIVCIPLTCSANIVEQILIAYNRFKIPAISQLLAGACNVLLVLLLHFIFRWEIYAILVTALVLDIGRNYLFLSWYYSTVTKTPVSLYMKSCRWGVVAFIFSAGISLLVSRGMPPLSWGSFSLGVAIAGGIICISFSAIFLKKSEREMLMKSIFFRKEKGQVN